MEGVFIHNQALTLEQHINDGVGVAENGCLRYHCPDGLHSITIAELDGHQFILVISAGSALSGRFQSIGEVLGTIEQVAFVLRWCVLFNPVQGYWEAY